MSDSCNSLNTSGCKTITASKCLYYSGAPLTGSGILTSDSMDVVIAKLNNAIKNYMSVTNTGTTGIATYTSSSGILNIPPILSQLTGDATTSAYGVAAITLKTVNSNTGTFGSTTNIPIITVNSKGLVTAVSTATIPSLTVAFNGDVTGSGNVGSTITLTLDTVNSNVGSFGDSSHTPTITVNAKGLVTAASSNSIQITESQVTNLVSDLAAKQPNISLTTSGSSGSSTFSSNVLNVPTYTLSGLGGQPQLNGAGYVKMASTTVSYVPSIPNSDLANSSVTIQGVSVSLGGSISPIYGTGFVKAAGNTLSYDNNTYLTTISGITAGGELSGTYANPTLVNSAVINKILTGYTSGSGVITSSDSILTAIQKLNGNISLLTGAVIYQGTWNASTNTPTLVSGTGTKGYLYKVSVAGNTNIDGISTWNVGDSIVFNGTTWDKIDGIATEVLSVFGRTGAVVATSGDYNTSQVTENTNLYFTTSRVLATQLVGYVSSSGTITASDTVLSGIQKLNGNMSALVTGVSSVNGSTGAVTITTTGTVNQIIVSGGSSTTPTIAIASTYAGQTSITTLGTITTGSWTATAIADTYISSSSNWNTAYTNRITSLTTTGSSGAATLSSNTLNIPNYTLAGLGGVPTTTTVAGFALSSNVTLGTLTISTGLVGTSYNGSTGVTISIDSTVATLTGTQIFTNKTIAAVSNSITGLTNSNLSGSAGITNANLANSTISGISLGSSLAVLTIGSGLSGSSYNGSTGITIAISSGGVTNAMLANSTISGISLGSNLNNITFNNSGTGATSGSTYNGSTALTVSYNTLGAQPLATNLTSLAGLTYASLAFVKMSAAGTFSLDTNTYLTGNQTITLSSDVTGSGTTAITATISANAVTYAKFQQMAANTLHGNPTGSLANSQAITLGTGLSFSTTVLNLSTNLQSLSGLTYASTSFVKMTAAGTFALDTNTYLTSGTGVTTFSGGTTGLTPSSATSGAITLAGTLIAANGGTGYTSLASLAGDAAFTSAFQAKATNLTSLAALSYASTSFVKMTAAGTFALDVNTYLTTSSASSTYVPYSGATGAVNIGSNSFVSGAITSSGNIQGTQISIGSSLLSDRMIYITGTTPTLGTSQYGMVFNPTFGTTATNYYALFAQLNVTGSFAATNGYGIYLPAFGLAGGATITNKYGIYQAGTEANVFGGSLTAGAISGSTYTGSSYGQFGGAIFSTGSTGLGASGGSPASYTAGWGSSNSGRIIMGDGTGYYFAFSKRTGSVNTDVLSITDAGNIAATGTLTMGGAISGSTGTFSVSSGTNQLTLQTTGTDRAYIQANTGNLIINSITGNPLLLQTNSTTALTINSSQNATFSGTVTATSGGNSSDLTLKNVLTRDLSTHRIADKVSVIGFEWKDKTKDRGLRFGYGAQELLPLIPEAVYMTDNSTYAVDYNMVHTVLIDENTKRIQQLENEVATLKRRLGE